MDRKALSLPILVSLVVGNMIGTGIYLLPASLADYGTLSLISWVYTSAGAILIALTLARLNKRFPQSGGPYLYCKEAYGKLVGFIVGYTYWISNMVSIAALAIASISYAGFILPSLNAATDTYNSFFALALEIGAVWLFCIINLIGVHTAGVVQLSLTIIKITPLLILACFGMTHISAANLSSFNTGSGLSPMTAVSSAATLCFWAFIGLESATVPAENTRGYKVIYKATVYGTLIVAAVYILTTFVLMGMIAPQELKNSQFPFAQAATMLFGAKAAVAIVICAIISGLGALNGCTLLQGQIVYATARDHLFPHRFAKLSKHDVPVAGQILSASLVTILLVLSMQPTLLRQFNNMSLLASLLTIIVYLLCMLSEIKFASLKQRFSAKSVAIAMFASFYAVWMMASFSKTILLAASVFLLLGVPVYCFALRRHVID